MPFYCYKCDHCNREFEIRHGMFFIQEQCILCLGSECLTKIPSVVSGKLSKQSTKDKPGSLVKKHIEEYREELKSMKKEAQKSKI